MKLQLFSGTTWKPVIRWLRTGEKWAPEMHAIKKERNCLRPLHVKGMGMWLLFLWSCFYRSFHMRFIFMWSGLNLLSKSCFLPENIFPLFGFWITSVCLLYMMAYPGGGPLIEQCSSINGQVKTGVFIDWLICHLSARNFFFFFLFSLTMKTWVLLLLKLDSLTLISQELIYHQCSFEVTRLLLIREPGVGIMVNGF